MIATAAAFYNFAYGSNMSSARLRDRVPSARVIGRGVLHGHRIAWHKVSIDGSGKCDVEACNSPDAAVHGVVYVIDQAEKATLDRAEGLGKGYGERQVLIEVNGAPFLATMYFATRKDSSLNSYSWYKAHVLAGAFEHKLPQEYIAMLEAAEDLQDPDATRHQTQMALVPHR